MTDPAAKPSIERVKRSVLLTILALSWVASALAWAGMESAGTSSPILRVVFAANAAFHPIVFAVLWRRPASLAAAELACLIFATGVCGGCMGLRFYAPTLGASIDLQPLYLWTPIIYVFAFARTNHRSSLVTSASILAVFILISLPFVIRNRSEPVGNFTIQLHFVSAVLIAALYLFSSYLQRFRKAQLTADEMAYLASTDELTKVGNRRRTAEVIRSELVRFTRYGRPFSIVLIDLDHFKGVNDRLGHQIGDQTLVAIAARINGVLRGTDTLGRWGGEEFIVVLPETGAEATLLKAEALCGQVAARPLVDDHPVTISCGVTTARTGDSIETLVERADRALYAAKKGGRDRAAVVLDGEPQLVTRSR